MSTSNAVRVPAEFPQEKDVIAAECGPMSLQNAADCHGHEIHPQGFVRLVGCHEPNSASHEDQRRLH